MRESEGIAGYHLNGDIESWGELEPTPDQAADTIEELLVHVDYLESELANGSFYKENDIDAMQNDIAQLKNERNKLQETVQNIHDKAVDICKGIAYINSVT